MKHGFFPCFLGISLLFCGIVAIAGDENLKIDSLKQVTFGLEDNEGKVDKLLLLSQSYYGILKLDSALVYCEMAGSLSIRLDYDKGIAESLFRKGLIQNKSSNYIAAITSFRQYLELIQPTNENKNIVKGFYYLGNLLRNQGNFDSAMYCYHQSLSYCRKDPDTLQMIGISNAIGTAFLEITSQYDSASFYYLGAIKMCQASGNEKVLGLLYNNLGKTFYLLGENDKAMEYLDMAVDINRKTNDNRNLAIGLTLKGAVYASWAEYDKALGCYDQAMELLKPFGMIREMADLYQNYAAIYEKQGIFQPAIEYYSMVANYSREQKLTDLMISVMRNIGIIYSRQGKFAKAEALYDSCLQIAGSKGLRKTRMIILDAKFNNYSRWGKHEKAFKTQSEYYALKDSLVNIEKTKQVNELNLKYEKEQDQARILALENENLAKDLSLKQQTMQRNAILYSAVILVAISLFLFLYFHQRRIKDRVIAGQRIQQLEEEKKLMAARLLVEGQEEERKRIATELHDGLGVLLSATRMQFSTISDNSPENKNLIEKASKMLEQASGDVRKISHNMMPGLLAKFGIYDAIEDLIEQVDDAGKIKALCLISGDRSRLPENHEIMLYRIIQEMVNNTLKHSGAANVRLQIKVLPGMLDIIYADDGKGFDFAEKLAARTIGLRSIQSRVSYLNGTIEVDSRPGEGAKYILQIPDSVINSNSLRG